MSARSSGGIRGRPGRDFQRQYQLRDAVEASRSHFRLLLEGQLFSKEEIFRSQSDTGSCK